MPNHESNKHEEAKARAAEMSRHPAGGQLIEHKIEVDDENAEFTALWCGGRVVTEIDALDETKQYKAVNVPTKNGVKRASQGDTIVKYANGSFSVLKHG